MRIAITGMGAVSPAGAGVAALWSALLEGRCLLRPLTRFDTAPFPFHIGGEVPAPLPGDTAEDRTLRFGVAAAAEALAQANGLAGIDADRIAVVAATNFGGMASAETLAQALLAGGEADPQLLRQWRYQALADRVAETVGARGPRATLSLSCSSGTAALAFGLDLLRAGRADAVVTVGADTLTRFCWGGLGALRTMTRDAVRPFAANRSGTLFSEGAGCLIVERATTAHARGATLLAEAAGAAVNNNAFHMTAPARDSAGIALVLRAALADAGLPADVIDHFNAHGTATAHNDSAEARAMREVFGARAAQLPVAANKACLGHTLGAAGSLEAIVTVLSLREGRIPPTPGVETVDPACAVDLVLGEPREQGLRAALSSSSGIGGNNAAVVLLREVRA